MSLVTSLSKYICIPIFTNWLELWEICLLDSAMCNHKERQLFMTYIHHDHITFHGMKDIKTNSSIRDWLDKREIMHVRHLALGSMTLNPFQPHDKIFEKLEWLSLKGDPLFNYNWLSGYEFFRKYFSKF